MAKYMLLIFGDPAQWEAMTPEQGKAHDAAHAAFASAAGPRIASRPPECPRVPRAEPAYRYLRRVPRPQPSARAATIEA
jgi:hypothetical protein